MSTVLSELLSAVLQVAVFSLLPFIFFLFRKNKVCNFWQFVGLTPPPARALRYAIGLALLFVGMGTGLVFAGSDWRALVLAPGSVTGTIRALGPTVPAVIVLLLTALVKTSLAEEIFFRGFLGQQFVARLGFRVGNLLQAVVFGLAHVLLFGLALHVTPLPLAIIFVFSTLAGWLCGYVKKKYAQDSIVPGWLAHGLGNAVAYTIICYGL